MIRISPGRQDYQGKCRAFKIKRTVYVKVLMCKRTSHFVYICTAKENANNLLRYVTGNLQGRVGMELV